MFSLISPLGEDATSRFYSTLRAMPSAQALQAAFQAIHRLNHVSVPVLFDRVGRRLACPVRDQSCAHCPLSPPLMYHRR